MFVDTYASLLKETRYQNISELGFAGAAFDGVWAMVIGLDIATKRIAAGNESGCENLTGDLMPLEYFNYTNEKLGCIMKQSFGEVQFLGITVGVTITPNKLTIVVCV